MNQQPASEKNVVAYLTVGIARLEAPDRVFQVDLEISPCCPTGWLVSSDPYTQRIRADVGTQFSLIPSR